MLFCKLLSNFAFCHIFLYPVTVGFYKRQYLDRKKSFGFGVKYVLCPIMEFRRLCDKDMSWNFGFMIYDLRIHGMRNFWEKNIFSLRWLAWRCEKLRSKYIVQSFFKLRYLCGMETLFSQKMSRDASAYWVGAQKSGKFQHASKLFALNTVVIVFLLQLKCAYVKLTWTLFTLSPPLLLY